MTTGSNNAAKSASYILCHIRKITETDKLFTHGSFNGKVAAAAAAAGSSDDSDQLHFNGSSPRNEVSRKRFKASSDFQDDDYLLERDGGEPEDFDGEINKNTHIIDEKDSSSSSSSSRHRPHKAPLLIAEEPLPLKAYNHQIKIPSAQLARRNLKTSREETNQKDVSLKTTILHESENPQ